ncbi:hypothetical protein HY442_00745 [Candidatus Parcubacteria bacterium]|nr:hypothetical protein [Candidatus Parcubacteria bacterium]MBI4099039.1 hypothetical protein [Candidatus Parcubacteria bacterium]
MRKILFSVIAAVSSFLPLVARGQGGFLPVPQQNVPNIPTDLQGLIRVIDRVGVFMFGFLLVGAFIMFMIGAFMYLVGGGSPDAQKNAKNYLIYAAVAVIVGFAAFAIAQTLKTVVGAQ